MEIIARLLFVIIFLVLMDLAYGLIGLVLVLLGRKKYPRVYRSGLRCLAMSTILGCRLLPKLCRLDCKSDQCGNWTCPAFHDAKKIRQDLDA